MAEQVLTTLFVVPTANTLPTTGTDAALTSGQFGIFLPDYTPATTGNVGSAKYIYMAQGRNIYAPGETVKKSDAIYGSQVIKWYKVIGALGANNQITEISAFNFGCNENVSITLRLDSYYIRTIYQNGLTRSVMVTTPCCNCGSNPCDTLGASDYQATVQALAQSINSDSILSQYVTAGTNGTGLSTTLWIQGLPINVYGQGTSTDLTNFPYQYDRAYFWTFVYTGPELTNDYQVIDACNIAGTVTIVQHASFAPVGAPAEVAQMEKWYYYDQMVMKPIFANVNFNGEFQSYVDSASAYDLYYLNFFHPTNSGLKLGYQPQDEWVIIALPQGSSDEAGMLAILTAFLGTPVNATATPSTSTSLTTSSTTTTTTTSFPAP